MAKTIDTDRSSLGGELYPADEDKHGELVSWCLDSFQAADRARTPYEDRFKRYYKLYRSYVEKKEGDWRSRAFLPIAFWIVETITPRLVARLPKFIVNPVGPEDVTPAQVMEELLDWAAKKTDLHLQLVEATKDSLIYGTGLLKSYQRLKTKTKRVKVPVTKQMTRIEQSPVIDPATGIQALDIDGQPLTEDKEVIEEVEAGFKFETQSYVAYDGPAATWVDPFDFYPAPEAADVESARYVIHRTFIEMKELKARVKEGIYRFPDWMDENDVATIEDESWAVKSGLVGLGGQQQDTTRKPVELLEFWTKDGRVITMANRKAIIRHAPNPFDHGEKPFVRIVDHLVPGTFWGIGEIEVIEGLQDLQNSLVNRRIDAVNLTMHPMFAVNENMVADLRDLVLRPGGVIRVKGAELPQEVIHRVDLGDVNESAYKEAQVNQAFIEMITAVTAYQSGQDTPSLNDTATGVQTMTENGATRFALKSRLAELMGLKKLAEHFGSNLQQFTDRERILRLAGPRGVSVFATFDPESLQGSLDYDIETGSQAQTEAERLNQAFNRLQILSSFIPPDPMTGQPGPGVTKMVEDVYRESGIKDIGSYLPEQPMIDPMTGMPMDPAMAQMQGMGPGPGEPGGTQVYGQSLPPGAIPYGQQAAFGTTFPGASQAQLSRALMRDQNERGEAAIGVA